MSDVQPRDWEERLKAYLLDNGLRLTRQRMVIAEAFFDHDGHPGIDALTLEVRDRDPNIGQATVYRTLKLLVESGLANMSRFGGSSTRYEVHHEDAHHDHLVCTQCGRIIEFVDDAIEALQEKVARTHDFEMHDHKMEIYGVCRLCRGS
jgi:Fur family ferric uptake transcriptional regulator